MAKADYTATSMKTLEKLKADLERMQAEGDQTPDVPEQLQDVEKELAARNYSVMATITDKNSGESQVREIARWRTNADCKQYMANEGLQDHEIQGKVYTFKIVEKEWMPKQN